MHVTEGQDQFHPLMGVAEIEGCIFNISDLPNDKKYDVMVQLLRWIHSDLYFSGTELQELRLTFSLGKRRLNTPHGSWARFNHFYHILNTR